MTIPRCQLVDVEQTRYYHCISRCVRRAFLCGKGFEHRKTWIENRLQTLAENFAVSVCGFALMDNHLHILCRLDPLRAEDWSDQQVVRRWIAAYPPKSLDLNDSKAVDRWIDQQAQDQEKVAKYRERLRNLGWFMKALKEPLARMANKEDDCKGTFWEGRYKSIAILDEEALLATCVYIDLNPLAAGVATVPEKSAHTSLKQRVAHAKAKGKLSSLKEAAKGSVAGSRSAGRFEEDHWLCPLEDLRKKGSSREGMLESFSLGSYLLLVDWTSRLHRKDKAHVPPEVVGILERLGSSAEYWEYRLTRLLKKARLMGSYASTSRARLEAVAAERGVHHVDNALGLASAS